MGETMERVEGLTEPAHWWRGPEWARMRDALDVYTQRFMFDRFSGEGDPIVKCYGFLRTQDHKYVIGGFAWRTAIEYVSTGRQSTVFYYAACVISVDDLDRIKHDRLYFDHLLMKTANDIDKWDRLLRSG